MVEVIVIAEGETEEKFIKLVVAPALQSKQIFLKPQQLNTSRDAKGGAINFERLKHHARKTLRQHPAAILTTLLDLYGLSSSFPSFSEASKHTDVYERTKILEAALHQAIVDHVGCNPERFIPHIQPYEFEGLLFSDVDALSCSVPTWDRYFEKLQKVRNDFPSPEHINDSYETKPSKRLETILRPKYKKTRHGPLAAGKITLGKMEQECAHFKGWLDKLRQLAA